MTNVAAARSRPKTRVGLASLGGGGGGGGTGSRYKVTARCVPEVSITSPTNGHYHELQPPSTTSSASPSSTSTSTPSPSPSPQPPAVTSHAHSQQLANHHSSEQLPLKNPTAQQSQLENQLQSHPQSHHKQQQQQHNNNNKQHHKKSKSKQSSDSNSHCYSNYNYNNINSINNSNSHSHSQPNHNISNSNSNSKSYLLRSKHTNNIYSSGATLVEEEDFNELTAVPTATIVIATNVNGKVRVSPQISGNVSSSDTAVVTSKRTGRHLPPPLKLTTITRPGPSSTKNALKRQQATQQQQQKQTSPTSASLKLTAQASEESQPTELTPLVDTDDKTLSHSPVTPTFSSNTNTTSSTQRSNSTAIAASVSPTSIGVAATTQFGGGLTPATSAASINATIGAANSPNVYGQQSSVPAAPTAPPPTVVAAAAAAAAAATTTTYSHNSKTTRSWPVIYRNPHHYDYEALYVQANSGSGKSTTGSNHHYHH
ncbi:probable serine/threonine-protein kinase roco9, partial [Rhagoletis pomonella]|uniref:probable serine/threonine-protein kinase roco9 n=1 Tax=Rhagoletis pomonella TaxID=28610 RepID=UPI00177BFC56